MFKSIKWKFILVYFLLVFIAVIIVGAFIVTQFEKQQNNQVVEAMKKHVEELMEYSSTLHSENWETVDSSIQDLITKWPTSITDKIYIISKTETPKLVASTSESANTQNMYDFIDSELFIKSISNKDNEIKTIRKENNNFAHLSYPVMNKIGEVKGVVYITSDLKLIDEAINQSKMMLVQSTALAIFIAVALGYFMASSITGPIRDVTVQARNMAEGDFSQHVEIHSEDEIGQLAGMFNTLSDELQRTISQIFKEKSKMETIFNYMADGLLVIDTDGKIMHVNQVAQRILRLPYNSVMKLNYADINEEVRESINLKYMKDTEHWIGNEICEIGTAAYRVQYAPFRDENRAVGGLIVVFQDITEQQKLDNMRREFVANVSHELKTPITTIKTYTETIIDGVIDDREMTTKFLNVVYGECDRMNRIVSDLLQLSHMDHNQKKWNFVSINMDDLIEDVCLKMQISAKEKGHEFKCFVQSGVGNIHGDRDAIEQVILNIVSNAIKYTPEGGEINIQAYNCDEMACIEIEDNGMGIPEKDLPRIFERFYRVDKARSREMGGTGLGLAIAKQILEENNGEIILDSSYGKGTIVKIKLQYA